MKNYAFNSAMFGNSPTPYVDYLKLAAAEENLDATNQVRYEVLHSARELIATHQQLAQENINVIKEVGEDITNTLREGFDRLSYDMRLVSDRLTEINSTLQWGFSEALTAIGKINDSLDDLIRIAKTQAQTWAYNQFQIAREAMQKQLYPEALEALDRAINGFGDNPGYKLEYRFHYYAGLIRLGSFANNDPSVVDLSLARQMFLNAARYARADFPSEAVRALICAGWASYCEGEMNEAREFTLQALEASPDLGEANFQLAKILMHMGDHEEGFRRLQKAISQDRGYIVKAAGDDDFISDEKLFVDFLAIFAGRKRAKAKKRLDEAVQAIQDMQAWQTESYASGTTRSAIKTLEEARRECDSQTLYGFMNAVSKANDAIRLATTAIGAKRHGMISWSESKLENFQRRVGNRWIAADDQKRIRETIHELQINEQRARLDKEADSLASRNELSKIATKIAALGSEIDEYEKRASQKQRDAIRASKLREFVRSGMIRSIPVALWLGPVFVCAAMLVKFWVPGILQELGWSFLLALVPVVNFIMLLAIPGMTLGLFMSGFAAYFATVFIVLVLLGYVLYRSDKG